MSTMKNLVIRPADVSLNPLGEGSNVADARVSVVYDRDVWVDGQPVPRVPLISTSIPTGGLRVPVLASDDPTITEGAGFVIKVVVETAPRVGQHNEAGVSLARTIQVVTADPAEIPLGSKSNLTVVPDPAQYADVMSAITAAAAARSAAAQVKASAATMAADVAASKAAATQAASSAASMVKTGDLTKVPPSGFASFFEDRKRYWAPITYWWADFWNANGNWARTLTDPDVLGPLLINVGNGAGSAVDQDWLRQVKIARARGGKIMGYVSTMYGQRSRADILADVDKHVRFYGVDGIFLDEMTNGIGDGAKYVAAYRDLYLTLKRLYGQAFWVVGNPGTSTTVDVLSCADTVMVYESDAAYYLNPTWDIHPSYYADYPSTKFWHVVHTVTSREQALAVLKAASKLRPAFFYMTDLRFDAGASNPYATPPAQWLIDLQIQWARREDSNTITSISAAPVRVGQIAVVSDAIYMSAGTASPSDWKKIS